MCAFVVLVFVFPYQAKRLAWGWLGERLRNDLFCVDWDIQEGQHPLTGQRAANFRRDLEAT